MEYSWNLYEIPVEINTNGIPVEISMKYQRKSIGNPVKIKKKFNQLPMEINWKFSWNSIEISMKFK